MTSIAEEAEKTEEAGESIDMACMQKKFGKKQLGKLGNMVSMVMLITIALCTLCALSYAPSAYSASKTVLIVGDSLSAEYGLIRGNGWVRLLEKRIKDEKIDASIINASISGDTTSSGVSRLPPLLTKHRPDIVVLELGANDALRGLSLSATETNLRSMIHASQKAQAKVLLVGIQIPPNYGRDYTKKFFDIYPRLAKETQSPLVPFLLEGIEMRPDMFQADRIHPTADAQPILLNTVWPHLKPLLTTLLTK